MKFEDCYRALEKLNAEYLKLENSSELKVGKIIKVVLSMNVWRIYACVVSAIRARKIKNVELSSSVAYSRGAFVDDDKKVAVYSCITGKYDVMSSPLLIDDQLDYYLISDVDSKVDSVWTHLSIPLDATKYGGGMVNRFCKLNPWIYFQNYDYSIYVDGNIEIVSDIRSLCSLARDSKIGIAMHLHDSRDCVYKERDVCKLYKRGNAEAIDKQLNKFRAEGFPEHFGMVEATIIIVDLKNETAKKIMSAWWSELECSNSGRDQISFPYVLWKNGYRIEDVGCLGNNRRKNPKFRTKSHGG
ncbi:MAG: DUF616 domain-containing protein [Fibrobacter sp.]|nr:DUF616 domain-containing protein [Fibrobacter sp.]